MNWGSQNTILFAYCNINLWIQIFLLSCAHGLETVVRVDCYSTLLLGLDFFYYPLLYPNIIITEEAPYLFNINNSTILQHVIYIVWLSSVLTPFLWNWFHLGIFHMFDISLGISVLLLSKPLGILILGWYKGIISQALESINFNPMPYWLLTYHLRCTILRSSCTLLHLDSSWANNYGFFIWECLLYLNCRVM